MIFHKHNSIFIHIPKAGGTSIENLLWPDVDSRGPESLWMGFVKPNYNKYQTGGLQHLLAKQVREEVGAEVFEAYYKFTIVRNPWDKIISQFSYMQRRKDLREFVGMKKSTSFEKYLDLIQKKEHVQWKKQIDFITDDNGELLVNDVFKLENLNTEMPQLSSSLGIDTEVLPHHNKSVRKAYEDYYSIETKERVAEMYKEDIKYFNYQF